jgi:hypothetical protein
VRSAYMLANLPEGASVPYLPRAQSREHLPPALMDPNDPSMRIGDGGTAGESGQLKLRFAHHSIRANCTVSHRRRPSGER